MKVLHPCGRAAPDSCISPPSRRRSSLQDSRPRRPPVSGTADTPQPARRTAASPPRRATHHGWMRSLPRPGWQASIQRWRNATSGLQSIPLPVADSPHFVLPGADCRPTTSVARSVLGMTSNSRAESQVVVGVGQARAEAGQLAVGALERVRRRQLSRPADRGGPRRPSSRTAGRRIVRRIRIARAALHDRFTDPPPALVRADVAPSRPGRSGDPPRPVPSEVWCESLGKGG
jgi:hypothetical protein